MKTFLSCIFSILIFSSCGDDEELTLNRSNYFGEEIRTDGCYYFLNNKDSKYATYMFFYQNGVMFSFLDSPNITSVSQFTGSPDGAIIDETGTYAPDPNNPLATDVDDYRAGILYIGLGPLKFGINSEKIRNATQNFLHRIMGWPEFRVITGPAKLFWEFGW